jgi:hypothetical protein
MDYIVMKRTMRFLRYYQGSPIEKYSTISWGAGMCSEFSGCPPLAAHYPG